MERTFDVCTLTGPIPVWNGGPNDAIAHDGRVTCFSMHVGRLSQITGKFSFNCCCNQLLRPRSQQIRQRIRDPVSTCKTNKVSRFHSGVSPSVALLSFNNKSPRYAVNLQTP
jgi:hypothetical protein